MFEISSLIESGGLLLIAAIIFAETGLLVGFFLPGDTLLIGAGIFASQGKLPLIPTILVIILASIFGNIVGYHIGERSGKRIFKKDDGILFRREYTVRAEKFYEDHGNKTILLARFIPVVRTFAAVVAGVGRMDYKQFMIYNIIGGILWGGGLTLAGYHLGTRIPGLDHYINQVLAIVIAISLFASLAHILKDKRSRELLIKKLFKLQD